MKRTMAKTAVIGFFFLCTLASTASAAAKKQGYLGVSVERLDKNEKKELGVTHGVRVLDVVKGSPAEKAGIQEDDVLMTFGGSKIRTEQDLIEAVRETEPKTQVKVGLMRDKKKLDIDVAMGRFKSDISFAFSVPESGNVMMLGRTGGTYLGVSLHELNADLASYFNVKPEEGVLVLDVEEDSPAEKAGIKAGDVITQVDEEAVQDAEDVRGILAGFEEGEEVRVDAVRQKAKQVFKVKLEERDTHSLIRVYGDSPAFIREGRIGIDLPHLEIKTDHYNEALKDFREKMEKESDVLRKHLKDENIIMREKIQKDMEKTLKGIRENVFI